MWGILEMGRIKKYDRNHAKRLIRDNGFKCFGCGKQTFRCKTLKKYREVIETWDKLYWISNDGLSHVVNKATIDHVIPRSMGGTNHIRNKVILCATCNNKKGNSDPIKKPPQFYCKCGRTKSVMRSKCKFCKNFQMSNLIYNSGLRYLC